MDSSEVLNTINGMGSSRLDMPWSGCPRGRWHFFHGYARPMQALEQRKSAKRIIGLAKQAIYQEVSIPCDMTSAAKALIL